MVSLSARPMKVSRFASVGCSGWRRLLVIGSCQASMGWTKIHARRDLDGWKPGHGRSPAAAIERQDMKRGLLEVID